MKGTLFNDANGSKTCYVVEANKSFDSTMKGERIKESLIRKLSTERRLEKAL